MPPRIRIGFEVQDWSLKAFKEYTDEELLEYWYKLRLTCKSGELGKSPDSTELYVVSLQQEILERMKVNKET